MTQYSSPTTTDFKNVNKLGYFLDGWAELIEGMGDKATEVRTNVLEQLRERKMPGIVVSSKIGIVTITAAERREYTITTTAPGATTTIYVGQHGSDLYTSWRTFILPVLNQKVLLIALGIATFLGLFSGGIRESGGGLFGGPSQTAFSLLGWIGATIAYCILAAAGLMIAGRVLKGSIWAFIFIEPTIFDAEDITAMSLSAHKSLLRALDSVGIESSKLRIKQNFKGGHRDVTL